MLYVSNTYNIVGNITLRFFTWKRLKYTTDPKSMQFHSINYQMTTYMYTYKYIYVMFFITTKKCSSNTQHELVKGSLDSPLEDLSGYYKYSCNLALHSFLKLYFVDFYGCLHQISILINFRSPLIYLRHLPSYFLFAWRKQMTLYLHIIEKTEKQQSLAPS
jgi:hypothetical protein